MGNESMSETLDQLGRDESNNLFVRPVDWMKPMPSLIVSRPPAPTPFLRVMKNTFYRLFLPDINT